MDKVSQLKKRHSEIGEEVRILNFTMSRISGLHKDLKYLINEKAFKIIQDEFLHLHKSKQDYLVEASNVEFELRELGAL